MILADKIMTLRKQNGWSQEELAARVNVSRQTVSKWEGAQSVPELDKLLLLADLFGVTTDYLLKDEREEPEFTGELPPEDKSVRAVTLAEANEFLTLRESAAKKIAWGTLLCILSPIPLLLLSAAVEQGAYAESVATLGGMVCLFGLVAVAVALFLSAGQSSDAYTFLEKEYFTTEYGVIGMVEERQKAFRPTYNRFNLIGTVLCVVSPFTLFIGSVTANEVIMASTVGLLLAVIAAGVWCFISAGVRWASLQKLLQQGEYAGEKKARTPVQKMVVSIYWIVATAIYLTWSFLTFRWDITWIVWPVAGVLSGVMGVVFAVENSKK